MSAGQPDVHAPAVRPIGAISKVPRVVRTIGTVSARIGSDPVAAA